MLVLSISEDLNKLLKNCCLTSVTLLGELGGVMIMAIDLSIVFVVTVLSTKNGRTKRTGKMIDVILSLERCDV